MSCIKNLAIDNQNSPVHLPIEIGFAGAFRLDAHRNHKYHKWRHFESQVSNCFSGGSFGFFPSKASYIKSLESWILHARASKCTKYMKLNIITFFFKYFGCDPTAGGIDEKYSCFEAVSLSITGMVLTFTSRGSVGIWFIDISWVGDGWGKKIMENNWCRVSCFLQAFEEFFFSSECTYLVNELEVVFVGLSYRHGGNSRIGC